MKSQLLVTSFESSHEIEMKNYLIREHLTSDYYLAEKFEDLGCFIKDKQFVAVHFKYDADSLARSINNEE